MITQARLGLRLQRFEVIAVVVATLIVGVSALIVRWRLDAVAVSTECWEQWFGTGPSGATERCSGLVQTFLGINEGEAGKVMAAMAILPLFVGVFLGVPVVAREIEGGTAPTVWALAASRVRWLAGRLLPLGALVLLALGFLALTSELLWLGRRPWEVVPNFSDVSLHGPGVVARGLATFGLALLVGAMTGRILPAIIGGVVLCFVLYVGWQIAFAGWGEAAIETRPMAAPAQEFEAAFAGGTRMSTGFLTPDGRVIHDWEAVALAPPGVDPYEWLFDGAADEGYVPVMRGIPGTRYPEWALVETIGFGAIGLFGIALTFPIVDRRRPQ